MRKRKTTSIGSNATISSALGWLAQAEGESALYSDLRARLFIDVGRLQQQYRAAPPWLKIADGRLVGRPELFSRRRIRTCMPKSFSHFEPWMALSFTEGSIGGDIETIDLRRAEKFYGPASADGAAGSAATCSDPIAEEFRAAPTDSPSRQS